MSYCLSWDCHLAFRRGAGVLVPLQSVLVLSLSCSLQLARVYCWLFSFCSARSLKGAKSNHVFLHTWFVSFLNPKVPRVCKLSHFSAGTDLSKRRWQIVLKLRPCVVEQSLEWLSCLFCQFGNKRTWNLEVVKIKVNFVVALFEALDTCTTMKQAARSAVAHLAEVSHRNPFHWADRHWAWATAAPERHHCGFHLRICQGGVEGTWCQHLGWATTPLMWSFSLSWNQNCLNSYLSEDWLSGLEANSRYQLRQTSCGSKPTRLGRNGLVFVRVFTIHVFPLCVGDGF